MSIYLWSEELDPKTIWWDDIEAIYVWADQVWSAENRTLLAYQWSPESTRLEWDWNKWLILTVVNYIEYDTTTRTPVYLNWEIWFGDTDYWMPTLKQMWLTATINPSSSDLDAFAYNQWLNLYIPWITTKVWQMDWSYLLADLSNYDAIPSNDWYNACFLTWEYWSIIWNLFINYNTWYNPEWKSLDYTGWQLPWTIVLSQPYSYIRADWSTWNILANNRFFYIPWDYSITSNFYNAGVIYTSSIPLPRSSQAECNISSPNKSIEWWKMRIMDVNRTHISRTSDPIL